jgi:pimeloyl-ACP methyl ester carboxylesterase
VAARPFHFIPDVAAIADLRLRLANARAAPAARDPEGRLGADPALVARLAQQWAALDWDAFAARVNALPHFTTDHAHGVLHFIQARSARADAMPLLLLHGWPGSFLEFLDVIPALTKGFHVVCPSLPGFGFSTRSLDRACDQQDIAAMMVKLMAGLGYGRFLVQGGDWGAIIGAEIGRRHPAACAGVHLNLVYMAPPPADDAAYTQVTADETRWLADMQRLQTDGAGYYIMQQTRPQTIGQVLSDTPYGLLTWIAEKFAAWSDRDRTGASLVTDARIVEHAALYWITNTIATAARLYHDGARLPPPTDRVTVPTAVAVFPRETMKVPKAWAAYRFNLAQWTVYARGGHFAALEVPDLLVGDIGRFAAALQH